MNTLEIIIAILLVIGMVLMFFGIRWSNNIDRKERDKFTDDLCKDIDSEGKRVLNALKELERQIDKL